MSLQCFWGARETGDLLGDSGLHPGESYASYFMLLRGAGLLRLVVALGLSGFLLSGGLLLGQPSGISGIEITCAEPTGCFLRIGQAIRQAPEGAHLRIGPGVYYEKPLVVEKSLVLQGAGASRTQIRLIDPDAVALAVEGRALSVRIEDLTLQGGPFFFPSERWDLWTGAAVLASGTAPDQPVQLRIERSQILGWSGIALPGNVYLSLRESTVIAQNVGILSLGSSIEVRDSRIESAWSAAKRGAGIDASFAERVWVQNSLIRGYGTGISYAIPVPPEREPPEGGSLGELVAISALVEQNDVGIFLAGLVGARLEGNRVENNAQYGLLLALLPCVSTSEESRFRGAVHGAGNRFARNGQDLCPEDYPWPDGFKHP